MSVQQLRPSQIITTYGPGAIIEAPGGPGVMLSGDQSDLYRHCDPRDLRIVDRRLEAALDGALLTRIPSNAELGRRDLDGLYRALPFPSWSLCVRNTHDAHVLYSLPGNGLGCPLCHTPADGRDQKARREAIRYVAACSGGHLDDVSWGSLLSHSCYPTHLLWEGGGRELDRIVLRCPSCNVTANFGDAFKRRHPCTGRQPERLQYEVCGRRSRILLRSAANLRIADVVSAITIPPPASRLHLLLEEPVVLMAIAARTSTPFGSKQELLDVLRLGGLGAGKVKGINDFSWADIQSAIAEIQESLQLPAGPGGLKDSEFEALTQAAEHGHPTGGPDDPDWHFVVDVGRVRRVQTPAGGSIRVTPVERLRVVMVQRGFRRLIEPEPTDGSPSKNQRVPTVFTREGDDWLLAVEHFGEGVFVDDPRSSSGEPIEITGRAAEQWLLSAHRIPSVLEGRPDLEGQLPRHPNLVWWHSLSHRLLNALEVFSGYHSASLRERIYTTSSGNGRAPGGVLIYTAHPGSDGTLGGLESTTEHFGEVLGDALDGVDLCSNDPICQEQTIDVDRGSGSACYACLMASETSCEFHNLSLDRQLIRENPV